MAMLEKKSKSGKSNYFKDVGKELKKVNYPNVATVRKNTLIVIILSIIVGIFIAALDYGFGEGARLLLNDGTQAESDYNINWQYDEEGNPIGILDENGNFISLDELLSGEDIYEDDGHDDHEGHNH